jgi:hypothetical protein
MPTNTDEADICQTCLKTVSVTTDFCHYDFLCFVPERGLEETRHCAGCRFAPARCLCSVSVSCRTEYLHVGAVCARV